MASLYSENDLRRLSDFRALSSPPDRSAFSMDTAKECGRVVHSMAFRRLQGKMQLFPAAESPLLRNRLTHSLEVADIAARIAMSLNKRYANTAKLKWRKIDTSIVTTAALAHDLGHPPFGHAGEYTLNLFMRGNGSFEANAQTFRILTKLENRFIEKADSTRSYKYIYRDPIGLNLMLRTLASVVKYDNCIADNSHSEIPPKGYYNQEKPIIESIKKHVLRNEIKSEEEFRTIECSVMELADDIAYSTYDLEDCLIAGYINPLDIISIPNDIAELVSAKINKTLSKKGSGYKINTENEIKPKDVAFILFKIFDSFIRFDKDSKYEIRDSMVDRTSYVAFTYNEAKHSSNNSLLRRRFTEDLIEGAIKGIYVKEWNEQNPALTKVFLSTDHLLFVEALKHFNYWYVIKRNDLEIYQHRAKRIILELCKMLVEDIKNSMLPDETREHLDNLRKNGEEFYDYNDRKLKKLNEGAFDNATARRSRGRMRIICDYVASLTDQEAVNLYAKMTSVDQQTIFRL